MNKVSIIAEAGVNHNGDIDLALELVELAQQAGADFVKFQSFKSEELVAPGASKADYQKLLTSENESQLEMLKKLELTVEDHERIFEKCKAVGIKFLSTPFDMGSAKFLLKLGIECFKIPSGELTNKPLLEFIGSEGIPVIMSTGMADLEEVRASYNILTGNGIATDKITLLHCTTDYPAAVQEVNLLAMQTMKNEFDCQVGYSDHTLGIEVPIAAVALGAVVIEKHFTKDRLLSGPDHAASLEPVELKKMVRSIRNIEMALGNGIKSPSKSELKNIKIARKSIHLSRNMKKGEKIMMSDLIMLRPGNGISPMNYEDVLEKELVKDRNKYDMLKPDDFK